MSVTFGLLLHRIIAYKHNRAALCNFQDGSCHLSRAGMVTFAITVCVLWWGWLLIISTGRGRG